jgi:polyphosphate kinase
LNDDLIPRLAEAGIKIVRWADIDADRRKELTAYFESVVFPILTPLAFDPAHPFPFVSNLSLSLAIELTEKDEGRVFFARVKVPPSLPRFVPLPGNTPAPPSSSCSRTSSKRTSFSSSRE